MAPENWMERGFQRILEKVRSERPVVCHGLSLSIGSPDPISLDFLRRLKRFFDDFEIEVYSEHISFCSLEGSYLYDLLPLPMTEDMVRHITSKAKIVQEFLERPLILENISYYGIPPSTMDGPDFINAILTEADACTLLLDVNNIYVNAVNHNFDPYDFIERIDLSRVAYVHVAGHERFERI
ncbi:MAG: DUF692 domain-containing protein [Aquificota bacterium]|nr:DUF692 domain-containing protein [Aquificota bacterium]